MKCWQAPADLRCLLIGRRGKLPNLPSEPTTTSILRPSLGRLLLVTMILPYSKQLLQLVWNSVDVQQLSRAESASLLVLFSAREAMMQEVPPNITLFLCAAWRRLMGLEMNYHSAFAARWLQCGVRAVFLGRTSSSQVSELTPYLEKL